MSPRSPAESDISDSPDFEDLEDEDSALLEAEFLKAKVLVASNQVRVTSHNADEQESDEDEDTNEDEEWEVDRKKKEEEEKRLGRCESPNR